MTSKDQFLTPEDKNTVINSSKDQYQNLNMKQDHQSLDGGTVTTEIMQLKTAIELSNLSDEPTSSKTQTSSNLSDENETDAKYCQPQSGPYIEEHKCIREPKFAVSYDKKYFLKTSNGLFWSPVPVPDFKQSSPQLKALIEKANEIQALISTKQHLSSGTFGCVSFCKIKGIKSILIQKTLKNISVDADEISAELNVYSQITSPFFPALFYAGFYNDSYVFILELVTGGTIDDHFDNIKFNDVPFIAFEIAQGLKELHDRNLTHGDLKGNNIAFTADGHIKLLDFGLSRNVATPIILPHTPLEAPEVRARRPAGASADIYCFGRIVLTLIRKGNMKFDFEKIDGGILAKHFLLQCLKNEPDQRIKNPLLHDYLQLQDPMPTYIPGVFVQKKQQPNIEVEDAKTTFGIQAVTRGEILKRSLIRFPSAKTFQAFFFE